MKGIHPYLTFDGNCREAMTFYEKSLGGELHVMPFSQAPGDFPGAQSEAAKDRVMHARLQKGSTVIMASDTMPGMPFQTGNNFSISIGCESQEETDRIFAALSEGGKVTMPLQDTFWGAYFGMLTDRFGTQWMLDYEKPRPA
jgi:PhnB protein